jgi:ABC-type hemin transport system ATPase subunit
MGLEDIMGSESEKEKQEKTFTVRDRRFSAQKEEGDLKVKEEKRGESQGKDSPEQDAVLPEINFVNFLFSISTSALIQMGEIEDPVSQQTVKNLPLAKQTIDLIGMLKEKTKGNLTPDEAKLMENILFDLRMRYVKATS